MKNLIFDFDGVLADTYEAAIIGRMKLDDVSREEAITEIANYFSKKPSHSRDHTHTDEEMADMYDWVSGYGHILHDHGFALFDDIVAEIEKLVDARIAVVSSGSQNYVLPALERTKLEPTHVLAFENHHSKEEKIELVCRDWGVELSEVYYFTDTLADVYELRDMIAPDKLVAVSWGYCTKEQLLTVLPEDNILDAAADIGQLFA